MKNNLGPKFPSNRAKKEMWLLLLSYLKYYSPWFLEYFYKSKKVNILRD